MPETFRYYQARRVVYDARHPTRYQWDLTGAEPPPGPRPARITERALLTPDIGTHLCEAAVSLWIVVLGYDAEWANADDVSDELAEWWSCFLLDARTPDDDYYVHARQVVRDYDRDGPINFGGWFDAVKHQGDYTPEDESSEAFADTEREALDDAFRNHLI